MKKFFYTCPIEAAYMAKNFEVKFWNTADYKYATYKIETILNSAWNKIVVSIDSLSIFEPQLNDDVEYYMHNCSYVGEMQTNITRMRWTKQLGYRGMEDIIHPEKRWVRKIIQRNGKPFIMPQTDHRNKGLTLSYENTCIQ